MTYIHSMQAALEGGGAAGLGDGALLARLAEGRTRRSAVAFEAIVGRHGPMVLAVCRQVLRDEHEAADAFQATFLVLAQSAQRLRDGDRLGGWLRGVARRVAVRVRSSRRREWADSRVEPWRLDDTAERRELRSLVAAEVARLPAAYRDAVRLCDLDGLPHEEAAARLGVAVGTVGSRVSRGRSILRRRLAGAGAASAALGSTRIAHATLTTYYLDIALRAWTAPGTAPAAASRLASRLIWSMIMTRWIGPALCVAAATFAAGTAARPRQVPAEEPPKVAQVAKAADPELAERYRKLVREWLALDRAYVKASLFRNDTEVARLEDDQPASLARFSQRFLRLAESRPEDPAARDSALWVLIKPGTADHARGPAMVRAADLLIAHHLDDPAVARGCMMLRFQTSPIRDRLLRAMADRSTDRAARGTSSLLLAYYLQNQALIVEGLGQSRQSVGLDATTIFGEHAQITATFDYDPAFVEHLKGLDTRSLRAEAEVLYQRVIDRYDDVPMIRGEGLLNLLTRPENQTLGDLARRQLDPIRRLVPGRVAPPIVGKDLDGRPMSLEQYRGKVVVLIFWDRWGHPGSGNYYRFPELSRRWPKDRVAVLGVNSDIVAARAKQALEVAKLDIPCWFDGGSRGDKAGPIGESYGVGHLRSTPHPVVIDERGIIRARRYVGSDVVGDVDALLKLPEVAAQPEAKAAR